MENKYLSEAWDNKPGRKVYGFRLKPFCYYYLHLLQSIDSPLLHPDRPFKASHLLIGAEICSSPWSEEGYTLDRILSPGQFRRRRNQLRIATCNFSNQIDAWRDYYADFLVEAKKWEDSGEEYDDEGNVVRKHKVMGRLDLDRVMASATAVIVPSGWDEEKVMMMPIGRAFGWADYFAIHAGNDKIKFVTAVEEAIEEAFEKKMAEEERKQKEKEANGNPTTK
jgi:hypothetical protein